MGRGRRRLGRTVAPLSVALLLVANSACSSDPFPHSTSQTDESSDGGPETSEAGTSSTSGPSPIEPLRGPWRVSLEGPLEACQLGHEETLALAEQRIVIIAGFANGDLELHDAKDMPLAGCSAQGDNQYVCELPEVSTQGLDGNPYIQSLELAVELTAEDAGTAMLTSSVACNGASCTDAEPCNDEATYLLTPFVGMETITPSVCTEEGTVMAMHAHVESYVDFVNETDAPVSRFLLDYSGDRLEYDPIAPGATFRQRSFATHPWLLEDASGECLGIYLSGRDIGVVTIE